jgi:hypothetical protein
MPKFIDLTGNEYGLLTVIEYKGYKYPKNGKNKRKHCHYLCQCSCGRKKEIMGEALKRSYTKSCGCLQSLNGSFHTGLDDKNIEGQIFGKLTVIKRDFSKLGNNTHTRYICKCECGNEKSIERTDLLKTTKSCGCRKKEWMYGEFKERFCKKK